MSNRNHARVRILIDDKLLIPIGTGFLIAPNLVITCAHVVADVLKIAETTAEKPTQTLFLDFPFVDQQPLQTAIVEAWYPVKNHPRIGDIEDLALLRLTENVTTLPFTLVDLAVYLNRAVHLTGFPKGKDEGIHLQGTLKEITGEGRVQIDTEQGRGSVAGGFSGGAVYDMQENGVVGIVVSIDTYGGDVRGYMIPATTLLKAFPQLDELSRSLNPYKNLFAFTEDDVEFFFGREQATEELYTEVNHKPFITVLGASGSGKSSLVLAGLIPRLKQQHWQILSLRLKREPFKNLALTLIPFLEADKITQAKKLDELSQDLESNKVKLSNLLSLVVKPPYLLFIDQFEELFTNNDTQTQQRFLSCLLELLTASPPDIKVLITLRADFMGQCLVFDNLVHVLKQNPPYLLTAMQQSELTAAINKPAAKLGVQFEKGLVAQLLREVGTEAGRLPLLQFTLTKLWEKQTRRQISFEAYQQLGGLEKSLVQYADEVWQSFQHDEKQQNRLRYALVQLVRPGLGTEDTRQVALRSDMEKNWDLIQELANKRLVVTGGDESSQTVEIVHEVLIKHWGRMQEWLREDRAFRLWQNNLRDDIKDWQKHHDDGSLLRGVKLAEAEANLTTYTEILNINERDFIQQSIELANREQAEKEQAQIEKERQRKRIIKGLLLFLSAITILAIVAGWQWYVAKEQTKIADDQTKVANARTEDALKKQSLLLAYLSRQETEAGRSTNGILLALEALPKDKNDLRPYVIEAEAALYNGLANYHKPTDFIGHTDTINDAVFSRDGQFIATASSDKTARIWDANTGKPLFVLKEHTDAVNAVDFSPDGNTIVTVSSDGTALLWDREMGASIIRKKIGKNLVGVKFSKDGKLVLISGEDSAFVWEIATNDIIFRRENVTNPTFDINGKYIATSNEKKVTISAIDGIEKIKPILTGENPITLFSPNGQRIAIVADEGMTKTISVWDSATGKKIGKSITIDNKYTDFWGMEFSADNNRILTLFAGGGDNDNNVSSTGVFSLNIDTNEQEQIRRDDIKSYATMARYIPNDGNYYDYGKNVLIVENEPIISGYTPNHIDIKDRRTIGNKQYTSDLIKEITFSQKGDLLLITLSDNTLLSLSPKFILSVSENDININDFHFPSTNVDKYKGVIENLKSKLSVGIPERSEICSVSSNGKKAVYCVEGGLSHLINIATGESLGALTGAGGDSKELDDGVHSAMFSLDDKYLMTDENNVWYAFPATQDLIDFAKQTVPHQLTQQQRKQFFLDYDEKDKKIAQQTATPLNTTEPPLPAANIEQPTENQQTSDNKEVDPTKVEQPTATTAEIPTKAEKEPVPVNVDQHTQEKLEETKQQLNEQLQKLEDPEETKKKLREQLVNFVRSYYAALDKRDVETALAKWENPPSKLTKMIENIEYFKVNEAKISNLETNTASVWIDVVGRIVGESTEQRWQGLVLLKTNPNGEWRIDKLKLFKKE